MFSLESEEAKIVMSCQSDLNSMLCLDLLSAGPEYSAAEV